VILYRWQGAATNFGDELNTVLWPHLLPAFFDTDQATRFMGIGSVLDGRHSPYATKLVAGSGYGGYESIPRLDENWIIHWVRGPRTAATLGLPASLGLGDPAVLIPTALDLPSGARSAIGFMPHFESAEHGAWQQAADQAGVRLIDPRDPPLTILRAMTACKLLLSEALHGVIVADALRIPWIAIRPLARIHRAKWSDWSATVDLTPRFRILPPSTVTEWARTSRLSAWHTTRMWLERGQNRLATVTSARLVARAGDALKAAAQADPQLSSDTALDRCQSRMLDAVHTMRGNPLRAAYSRTTAQRTRSRLQTHPDCAYELPVIG
jgi:succinoglycan biosynthesis protein ExoV